MNCDKAAKAKDVLVNMIESGVNTWQKMKRAYYSSEEVPSTYPTLGQLEPNLHVLVLQGEVTDRKDIWGNITYEVVR